MMKIGHGIFLILISYLVSCAGQTGRAITQLKTEYAETPLGIDTEHPRFSWLSDVSLQSAYQVRVAKRKDALQRGDDLLWDSQKMDSDKNVGVIYKGPTLQSRHRYYWQVRVWNADGKVSEWSRPSWWEMGLLHPSDWKAQWIGGPQRLETQLTPKQGLADDKVIQTSDEFCRPVNWLTSGFFLSRHKNNQGKCREVRPAPMLRTSFEVTKQVAKARVYATGLGYNHMAINGQPASESVLDPGFTDYSKTVLYTTRDVTDLIKNGENVISSVLGSGQFDNAAQTWDWGWSKAEWRATPRLRLQLEITFEDGSTQVITSDDSWKVSTDGPTRYDNYYLGETYDARREIPGWNKPGFDASDWSSAREVEAPAGKVRAEKHQPIQVVDERKPGNVNQPVNGIFVYDIGQNLTGWARIKVDAPAGTPIELFYSEKLDSLERASTNGNALVGGQLQTDYYIAKGDGAETWAPRFSYKGFRYLQISAPNGQPLSDQVSVKVEAIEQVRTGFEETSTFAASKGLLNRIYRNTKWAVQNNTQGIITDTPIYEKNGWTGDAQLTSGTASILFNTERLYDKIFQDMEDGQTKEGEVPLLSPSNENYGYVGKPAFKPTDCCGATPAWDAFWFIVPWQAYQRFGNRRGLEQTYPLMKNYLDNWVPKWTNKDGDQFKYTLTSGLGDWDTPGDTPRNIALSSTAYYARFAQIAADVARVLNKPDEAKHFDHLFENIREDFNARFLSPDGVYRDTSTSPFTQTAQILPLAFNLAPDSLKAQLAKRVADDIVNNRDGNLNVGILGARYILPVLTEAGYKNVAYAAATQTDYPSWGYWIDKLGWTSLGEYWEASSRSRDHHFFGTIVQWIYEDLIGIKPNEAGYKNLTIKPYPPKGLEKISGSIDTIHGTVSSSWNHEDDGSFKLDVTIPSNTQAEVWVPTGGAQPTVEGGETKFKRMSKGYAVYSVSSGSYMFKSKLDDN